MLKRVNWGRLSLVFLLFMMIAASLFLGGCKENDPTLPPGVDKNTLTVQFTARANAKSFQLQEKYTLASQGFNYNFELFKFYISQVRLVDYNGNETVIKDVDMIDFRLDKPHLSFSLEMPEGKEYKEIKFGIGVDSATNMKDPSLFSNDHPLSLSKGTYWDMASQYRFLLMEGRLDTAQTDSFNVAFVVHTGTNDLYREKTFERHLKFTKADHPILTFEIDIDAMLSNIDFKTNHLSHTIGAGFPLAQKIADNFANNITLKQ